MADASAIALYKIRETSQGVLPTNPVFKAIRRTDGGPTVSYESVTSAELRADRQPGYTRKTKQTMAGDIVAELTYGDDTDDMLEEVFCGTWTAKGTKTATTLSVTASTRTIGDSASGISTSGFQAGDKITITGFKTAGNNVVAAEILSVTAAGIVLTTETTTLVDEAAGNSVTITNNTMRLKAGTTRRSSAYLRDQTDITTGRYQLFLATQLDKFALAVEPNGFTKVTYTISGGQQESVSDTAPSGATFGTLTATKPVNAIEGVFKVDGTAVGNISKLDVTLENGIEQKDVLHSDHSYYTTDAASVKIGEIKVSGTMSIPYNDDTAAYITKMKAGTEIAIAERCEDVDGNAYVFNVPAANLTDVPTPYGTGAIMSDIPFTANLDATTACAFFVDKIPA